MNQIHIARELLKKSKNGYQQARFCVFPILLFQIGVGARKKRTLFRQQPLPRLINADFFSVFHLVEQAGVIAPLPLVGDQSVIQPFELFPDQRLSHRTKGSQQSEQQNHPKLQGRQNRTDSKQGDEITGNLKRAVQKIPEAMPIAVEQLFGLLLHFQKLWILEIPIIAHTQPSVQLAVKFSCDTAASRKSVVEKISGQGRRDQRIARE